MSLDKAIEHGKEKRRPYRGAKAIDATCRNHGSDKWEEGSRRYKMRDKLAECDEEDLFAELTAEEKAENKRLAKLCDTCRWFPPSSFDGNPCCACDTDDPMMNCYEPKEGSGT